MRSIALGIAEAREGRQQHEPAGAPSATTEYGAWVARRARDFAPASSCASARPRGSRCSAAASARRAPRQAARDAVGGACIATYHPSAVLRAEELEHRDEVYGALVADLRTAARLARHARAKPPAQEWPPAQ
jgi:hypothetical protein